MQEMVMMMITTTVCVRREAAARSTAGGMTSDLHSSTVWHRSCYSVHHEEPVMAVLRVCRCDV